MPSLNYHCDVYGAAGLSRRLEHDRDAVGPIRSFVAAASAGTHRCEARKPCTKHAKQPQSIHTPVAAFAGQKGGKERGQPKGRCCDDSACRALNNRRGSRRDCGGIDGELVCKRAGSGEGGRGLSKAAGKICGERSAREGDRTLKAALRGQRDGNHPGLAARNR